MTIKCGGITLDGPYPLTQWEPPYRAAVYAILMKRTKPDTYRILYFGESVNLSERGFYKSHHKYTCFIDHAKSDSNLFIGIHKMLNSTPEQRHKIEKELIDEYNPICNR